MIRSSREARSSRETRIAEGPGIEEGPGVEGPGVVEGSGVEKPGIEGPGGEDSTVAAGSDPKIAIHGMPTLLPPDRSAFLRGFLRGFLTKRGSSHQPNVMDKILCNFAKKHGKASIFDI